MSPTERIAAVCLFGLILSLLLVGVVSATPIRRGIQVVPAAISLAAVGRRATWAKHAALPVFLIWFLIVVAIWLWLLGIARTVTGRFTPAEVLLTVIVAVSCALGFVALLRIPAVTSRARRRLSSALFAVFQVGTVWVSLRPPFAQR